MLCKPQKLPNISFYQLTGQNAASSLITASSLLYSSLFLIKILKIPNHSIVPFLRSPNLEQTPASLNTPPKSPNVSPNPRSPFQLRLTGTSCSSPAVCCFYCSEEGIHLTLSDLHVLLAVLGCRVLAEVEVPEICCFGPGSRLSNGVHI